MPGPGLSAPSRYITRQLSSSASNHHLAPASTRPVMTAELVTIPVHLPAHYDLANLTLSLNLSFTDYDWETDLREVIELSDFNEILEQFREDKRHLSDPAYSIILLCYSLVLIVAGLGTTELNFNIPILSQSPK